MGGRQCRDKELVVAKIRAGARRRRFRVVRVIVMREGMWREWVAWQRRSEMARRKVRDSGARGRPSVQSCADGPVVWRKLAFQRGMASEKSVMDATEVRAVRRWRRRVARLCVVIRGDIVRCEVLLRLY